MTENLPKDGVQSRQAVAQRCCLKCGKLSVLDIKKTSESLLSKAAALQKIKGLRIKKNTIKKSDEFLDPPDFCLPSVFFPLRTEKDCFL